MYGKEIEKVLITNEDVRNRLKEVAKKIGGQLNVRQRN